MLSKSNNYIISLSDQAAAGKDLIGAAATNHIELLKNEIPLPTAFAITTLAFDDFLTAGNIIEEVTDLLSQVNGEYENTKSISKQVSDVINRTTFPSIIMNPIMQAYRQLSGFTDKYVTLRPSWILNSEIVPSADINSQFVRENIKGDASLLHAIKQVWLALFSPQALQLRYTEQYDGDLSMAILVQTNIQAEISGSIIIPADHHSYPEIENLVEVNAILGIEHQGDDQILPDVYIIDGDKNLILEKTINPQQHMYIRKSRGNENVDTLVKIEISPEWQRRQKLSDKFILDLGLIAKHSSNLLDSSVEITWSYDAGKIIVDHINRLADYKLKSDDLQNQADAVLDIQNQDEFEIVPPEPKNDDDFDKLLNEVELLSQELHLQSSFTEAQKITDQAVANIPKIQINLEDYDLHTKLIYDMSPLSSGSLSKGHQFNAGYFDATQMIMRHHVLPESIFDDKMQLNKLVELFADEISTVSKAIDPKMLFYEFSDLNSEKLMKLSGSISNDHADGAERFVIEPNALFAEILAIKKAKHTYESRNISVVIPRLRSEPELLNIKKLLSSEGIKRVGNLEIWAEIATPAFLHELQHIKTSDIDGLIIDLPQLITSMVGRTQIIERDIETAFRAIANAIANSPFRLILRAPATETIIEKLEKYNLTLYAMILGQLPESSFLRQLERLDRGRLSSLPDLKKAGRPQKPLFVRK